MKHVTVTEAKAKFSELLTAVENGETIAITRHGEVIAQITPDEAARQKQIDRAIDGIRALRKRVKPVSLEEILAWRDEGRK
jgi:prevent-host-death family protein